MKTAYLGPLLLPLAGAASAQAIEQPREIREFTAEEVAAIPMPETAFDIRRARVGDFDKYYYFHREGTSFAEAFADITECDDLASGLASYRGNAEPAAEGQTGLSVGG